MDQLTQLAQQIRACRRCVDAPLAAPLPHEPRPVLRVSTTARILVAGQAPGVRVHASGVPFDDRSGDRLRDWMNVDRATFYDEARIAIVPMGFCFPGLDAKGSDLPPRPECQRLWHDDLMRALPQVELILLIGRYAQLYHLARLGYANFDRKMTEHVENWRHLSQSSPKIFPLPHPSWRNTGWIKRNPWFENDVLPALKHEIAGILL